MNKVSRDYAMSANFAFVYGRRSGKSISSVQTSLYELMGSLLEPIPDFPGGSKRFHRQIVVWTRDLDLGHKLIRIGPHIICSKCRISIAQLRLPFLECRRSDLSPNRLRKSVRKMMHRIPHCHTRVVEHVMDS